MQQKTNDVTLFSNGIGHFRRVYEVSSGEEARISIPFKTDYIGDVAASLQVFGKVKLESPPSFTPANSNATSLCVDQREALKSLLRQLSGAAITLDLRSQDPESYTLLGLDSESKFCNGEQVSVDYLIVMRAGAVRRFPFSDVSDVKFEDESVRTEIDKALKCNFQKIKPDSTLLDLVLTPIGDAKEAIVQYTIPVAAWKMRYAIREEGFRFNLEGAAIIDNNTDEDWSNFRVSVVTGNPISFNTDIATVVVPNRKFVHLVDRVSLGNVEVEEAVLESAGGGFEGVRAARARGGRRAVQMAAKMSTANYADFGLESAEAEDLGYAAAPAAEAPGVDSKEVGDFCIFSCKEPITILARKSAVVPMFSTPLSHAGVVLLYNERSHSRRPYRAIKFRNETEYSLGRGKTVIYNEGIFSGECVLDTTKPNDNRMLPHCLENGVKIVKESPSVEVVQSSINLSKGVAVTEEVNTARTEYSIQNMKEEKFKVALEHHNNLHGKNVMVDFSGVEVVEREKLKESNGWRLYFNVEPNQKITLAVSETHVVQQSVTLGSNWNWIQHNIIAVENPIAADPQILACLEVQKQIDKTVEAERSARSRVQEIERQVDRVRSNLESAQGVASGGNLDKWIKDLDDSEEEIRTLQKKTMPELRDKHVQLTEELAEKLAAVTVCWKADTPKAVSE